MDLVPLGASLWVGVDSCIILRECSRWCCLGLGLLEEKWRRAESVVLLLVKCGLTIAFIGIKRCLRRFVVSSAGLISLTLGGAATHADADIVTGVQQLRDSLSIWQASPPPWITRESHMFASEIQRDTLDAVGDSVFVRYPPLYDGHFATSYIEINTDTGYRFGLQAEWRDSVWVLDGFPIANIGSGPDEVIIQKYVVDRLLQLRLLLRADVQPMRVAALTDTTPVALTLVGRDVDEFKLTHQALWYTLRHLGGDSMALGILANWRKTNDGAVFEWGLFLRPIGAPFQHVLMIEDHMTFSAMALKVHQIEARFLPGVRMDNMAALFAEKDTSVVKGTPPWRVEIE